MDLSGTSIRVAWVAALLWYLFLPASSYGGTADELFAGDPDAWMIVAVPFKPAALNADDLKVAIGGPQTCGIACIDACAYVCNRQRDQDLKRELSNFVLTYLGSGALADISAYYDEQFEARFAEVQESRNVSAQRLAVCDVLNSRLRALHDPSSTDPVVQMIKRTGHPKLVSRDKPVAGLRRVFYRLKPGEGQAMSEAYRQKIEKEHDLVVYPVDDDGITRAIAAGTGVLVRDRDQFEELFAGLPAENMNITPVVSEQAAARAVTEAMSRWAYDVPTDGVTEEQISDIRGAALSGDANAQYRLAKLFETGALSGTGVADEQAYAQAVDWYRKAAGQGHMYAQTELGILFFKGYGVPARDAATAVRFFSQSAREGDVLAMYNLGIVYANGGPGVAYSYDDAKRWFLEALQTGDWYAEIGIEEGGTIASNARIAVDRLTDYQIALNRARQPQPANNCDMTFGFSCNGGVDMLGADIFMNIK